MKHTHNEDLKEERWRLKRQKMVSKAMFKCSKCDSGGVLEVHHLYYIKGKRLWQYPDKALIVLCKDCHTKWHEKYHLEYREEIWSEHKDYQAPENYKIYFVTKGGKSVRHEVPYKKEKRLRIVQPQPVSPLERYKQKIKKKKRPFIPKQLIRPDGVILDTNILTSEQLRVFMKKYEVIN